MLRNMIDNVLNKIEKFDNFDDSIINPIDECTKIDNIAQDTLNFQTSTNIPLSPYNYKNFIGNIYIDTNSNNRQYLNDTNGPNCLKKNKLLYDGIWESVLNNDNPYQYETWNLTNGNIVNGIYCTDKLFQVNIPFPENYIDTKLTSPIEDSKYYMYYNDTQNDVNDTEIKCFPQVFNNGL